MKVTFRREREDVHGFVRLEFLIDDELIVSFYHNTDNLLMDSVPGVGYVVLSAYWLELRDHTGSMRYELQKFEDSSGRLPADELTVII